MYNESVRDLLAEAEADVLEVRQRADGRVVVPGLTSRRVASAAVSKTPRKAPISKGPIKPP